MNPCLSLLLVFSFSCTQSNHPDLLLSNLKMNKSDYDGYVIDRSNGFHRLGGSSTNDSTYGIVTVHGYYPKGWPTKGFEWVNPLVQLSNSGIPVWFFRYDWDDCPENSVNYLYRQTEMLIDNNPHLDSLWIIGHSMGGVVTSLFAEKWDQDFPITIHSIAAPLAGMKHQVVSGCEKTARNDYYISSTVNYTQWKTVHSQDGAFRKLKIAPQLVNIRGGKSILLPEEWQNTRLGHNKSIQWVCENIFQL